MTVIELFPDEDHRSDEEHYAIYLKTMDWARDITTRT